MPYVEDPGGLDFDGKGPWKGFPADLVARILHSCEAILGRDRSRLRPDSRFVETGWESLELVELVMAIEQEFSFRISDAEAERISTIGQLVQFVKDRTG